MLVTPFRLPSRRRASRPSWIAALASAIVTCAFLMILTHRSRPEAVELQDEKAMTWLKLLPPRPLEKLAVPPAKTSHVDRARALAAVRAELLRGRPIATSPEPSRLEPANPQEVPLQALAASAPLPRMPDISDETVRSAIRAGAAERSLGSRAAADLKLAAPVAAQRLEQDVASAKKRDCGAPNPEEAAPIRGLVILAWTALSGRCAGQ